MGFYWWEKYCVINSAFPKERIGREHTGRDSDISCVNTAVYPAVIDISVLIFSTSKFISPFSLHYPLRQACFNLLSNYF